MATINKWLVWINSSRKLFVTVLALLGIQLMSLLLVVMSTLGLVEVTLTDIITSGFSADGIIVGAYCATNVGEHLVQGVKQWLIKKKK